MRIAAGELDRRLEIWRGEPVDDGTATIIGPPAKIATRWARKLDASDSERVRAAERGMDVTTRFLVRLDVVTKSLSGGEILKCEGRRYEVTGVKDSPERQDGREITAVAKAEAAV